MWLQQKQELIIFYTSLENNTSEASRGVYISMFGWSILAGKGKTKNHKRASYRLGEF